ncbi:MAG: O-antigen ligase family protein, partial [Polymorphobacter sp.]
SLTFAEFLALCMPIILHFIATTHSTRNRLLSLAGYALFTWGIWVSGSRLGVVGWFESHFLYLLFWSARRMYFNKSDMIAPALTYGFPAMFIGFWALVATWQRLRTKIFGTGAAKSSDDARRIQRDMAIPKILKHPIGYGSGQGARELNYRNPAGDGSIDSYFLVLGLDYGILGFIGYFGFFLSGAWTGLKSYFQTDDEEILLSGPLAMSLLVSAVIKLVLAQEQMQPLVFLFMGAIMALAYRHRAQRAAARTGGEFDKDALILVRG